MSVRKSPEQPGWDDLRALRAVAEAGTLTAAARLLGVQHTTVARRIDALERTLGARLFLRNPRGYTLTRLGETLRHSVEVIHHEVDRVTLLARGHDLQMEGAVRLATADVLATHVVVPALPALLRRHPGLTVELVSDTRQHDLARREADLALRLGTSRDPRLVGRRIATVGFALYRARRARPPTRAELRRAAFATFDESVGRLPHDEWLTAHAPQGRLVLRSNRQHTLIEAARLGLALSILPCLAADADPTLARVLGPERVFTRELWLLVHPDLQHAPRVRALMDAVAHHVARSAEKIAGAPGPQRSGVPASSSSKLTVKTDGS